MSLQVSIDLPNSRVFLFPSSSSAPRENEAAASSEDVHVRGEVVIASTASDITAIGPVKIVWEVARQRFRSNAWQAREVLARFENNVTAADSLIQRGTTRLPFSIAIPSLLPPTTENPFERTTHSILASVLESAPIYALGPVPEYDSIDDVAPVISARGSISELSDYSFSSRRSSDATEGGNSRRGSVGVALASSANESSRRSSVSSVNSVLSRRGSVENGHTEGESRRGSIASAFSPSRRGSAQSVSSQPPANKKKGLFSSLRRKSSTSSIESASSVSSTKSSVHPALEPTSTADGIDLPECMLPSLGGTSTAIEIVSCPKSSGEICELDWVKTTLTGGLGQSEKHLHTNLLSLGSSLNFTYKLTDIPAKTTLHALRVSMFQKSKSPSGDYDEEVFTLYSLGTENINHRPEFEPPKDGQFVFRGPEARKSDATDAKSGKLDKAGIRPQAKHPNVEMGDDWLQIKVKTRLPTPVIGAVPTSPTLLDDRLSRTKHRLRVEAYFSVLGEDELGRPAFPTSRTKRTREGVWRKTWVDHDIVIGSCCVTPENILVPTYSAAAEPVMRKADPERTEAAAFDLERTGTRTLKETPPPTSAPRGAPSKDNGHREILKKEVKSRMDTHHDQTGGKCLCFMRDSLVQGMSGSLDKANSSPNASGASVSVAEETRMRALLGELGLVQEKAVFVQTADSPRNPVATPVRMTVPQFARQQMVDSAKGEDVGRRNLGGVIA